jgi:DNA polymerase III epsilon subunit-like protein
VKTTDWVILDTETTGFSAPIFVVELAAQKMKGWEPDGQPFRSLLKFVAVRGVFHHIRDAPMAGEEAFAADPARDAR